MNISNSNIPSLNIGEITSILTKSYCKLINNNIPVKVFPSVMFWGPPGVGKSQAIRQLGQAIEINTGKKVHITDVRLLLFNPIDLRGIPTANEDRTLAVWLKPQIFQMDESDDVVNILFLDEISAAPQSVQAAAYQITLDRVVGEHRLPENCIIIAAGNRVTDKSVAYKMPKALSNRLLHFEAKISLDSWKQWAVKKAIHPKVTGFLSFRQDYLSVFDSSSDDLAFPTPRSWEMVSNILCNVDDDIDGVYNLIAGLVGTGIAVEFRSWNKVFNKLPDIEDIFNGKNPPVPKGTDTLYALTASMTAYAREHQDELQKISNSIEYADSLPPDFSALLLKDYMYLEPDYKKKLMNVPAFQRWLMTKGKLLNGII